MFSQERNNTIYLSADDQRVISEREAAWSLPEVNRNIVAKSTLEGMLPLEALIDFGDTWFAPGSKVDVNAALILRERTLQTHPRYNALLKRVYSLKDYSISERRDHMNPMRANILGGINEMVITILLDHERFLEARSTGSDRNGGDRLKTTQAAHGHIMERWLGETDYDFFARRSLEFKKLLKDKKQAGMTQEVIQQSFNTTLKLDPKEVQRRVAVVRKKQNTALEAEREFKQLHQISLIEVEKRLADLLVAKAYAPISKIQAESIYALGRLVELYLTLPESSLKSPLDGEIKKQYLRQV